MNERHRLAAQDRKSLLERDEDGTRNAVVKRPEVDEACLEGLLLPVAESNASLSGGGESHRMEHAVEYEEGSFHP